jgi:amidophosphoribosyltransferase
MPIAASSDQLTEKCAVFGVCGTGLEAARLTFYGLWALQHRGQESSGIASSDGENVYRHAAAGLVANVYREEDLEQLPGYLAIGHNRYSTSGGNEDLYNQPFVDRKNKIAFAHNGNLPDCTKLEVFLKKRSVSTKNLNDSSMMAAAIGCYVDDGLELADAIAKAYPLFTGVFSSVAMSDTKLVAFRDECGVRPLSLATLPNGGYVVASETCAFDTIGATFLRDVEPGEMIIIDKDGLSSRQVVTPNPKLDVFEFVYFARPDSLLIGKRVDEVRKQFGRRMAEEFPIEADVVVPVPDSAIPAALGFSQASGIPFEMGLIKNRYIHRTFIRPTAELRERDLKMKLNPVIETIKGQRVILVDDSIVRGTTLRKVVTMLFEAGAREVHLLISSPPVRFPDFYGINTPKMSELLAARMTVAEMCEHVGATSLNFLSYDGMIEATGIPASRFSTSCFNGVYPISIGIRAKEVPSPLITSLKTKSLLFPTPQTA